MRNIKNFKIWFPEYEDISDNFINNIANQENESFGTFQVLNGELNKKFDDFINKILEDIKNKNYNQLDKTSFYYNYFSSNKLVKLSYKTPLDWILKLNIIISFDIKQINGSAMIDENDLTMFGKNKILHGTIFLDNPDENNHLKDTLFHELKHLYTNFKINASNCRFKDNNFDLDRSLKISSGLQLDYNKSKDEIKNNLINKITSYGNLRMIISDCFYYLNKNEILSRNENLFCDLERISNASKYISEQEMLNHCSTYNLYCGIKEIIQFLLNNKVEGEKTLLENEKIMRLICKSINRTYKQEYMYTLHFLYRLFLSKLDYFFKHSKKMAKFIKLNIETA